MNNTVRYRVIESSAIQDIATWARTNLATGADFAIDGQFKQIYVIVPEVLLLDFLSLYGWAVSP